jgi:hypothetical protein
MDHDNLLLEVGAQAINDLSADELYLILDKYANGQETLAGIHVFNLLTKKFKGNWRMGRMYRHDSQKYEAYRQVQREYARSLNAGRSKGTTVPDDSLRDKFK